MLNSKELEYFLDQVELLYPDAKCELIYHNNFELLVSVVLSAQTTDQAVNKVTPILFNKYPDAFSLANALILDVENILKPLGLYKNKSKNIINLSKELVSDYNGIVPSTFEELVQLSGVGRKTANVVLIEAFDDPRMPVDTHVERVSKRIGVSLDCESVLQVEKTLVKLIPSSRLKKAHHLFIMFGRYFCKAVSPKCCECFFKDKCKWYHK